MTDQQNWLGDQTPSDGAAPTFQPVLSRRARMAGIPGAEVPAPSPAPIAPAYVQPATLQPAQVQPIQRTPIARQPVAPAAPQWNPPSPPASAWHPVAQQPQYASQPQYAAPPPAFGGTSYSNYQYAEPEPPKKRKPWLGILVTLGLFALVGVVGYHMFGGVQQWFDRTTHGVVAADFEGPGDEPVLVTIPAGATGTMMGDLLYDAGVVASPEAFRNAFRENPRANSIAPGTYELQLHMSGAQAVQAMLDNGTITFRLVIPEGFTAEQIFARIESVTGVTRDEIDTALADPTALGLPDVAGGNVEGWLFPATYQVQPNQDAASILRMLIGRTRQELTTQGADPEQWEVILNKAALIEREVRDDADRPKVARAIQNRLDRDMNLQIDAAVAYGLGISGTLLTRAHLADPSNPFNTYVHTGLPPTPIANPGAASIRAALHPAEGNWIFWVTVNLASGETWFSSTYEEHNRGVAELRAWQAANPGFGQPATGSGVSDAND